MKFSCERCGKKYATAERPAPGRVYKIKCKACGHLIVVKAAGASTSTQTEMRPPTSMGMPAAADLHPQATPDLQLEIGAPEPASPPSNGAHARAAAAPGSADATQEISMTSFGASTAHEEPAPPPPADGGYVDLFADTPKQDEPRPLDDPFAAAARASLPDGYGSAAPAPDPFAPLREELFPPEPPRSPAPAAAPPPPPPTSKVPVIPKPKEQKSALPVALIGGGVLVLVGILAFVLFSGKKPEPAPGAAQPPVAQQPAPAAQPAPQPQQVAQPAPQPVAPPVSAPAKPEVDRPSAADRKQAEADRREREDKKRRDRAEALERERQAREDRDRSAKDARAEKERAAKEARAEKERAAQEARAERERAAQEARAEKERERAARAERDRAERERREAEKAQKAAAAAAAEEPDGGLTQDQVQRVLSSTRKAFETCITNSGKAGEVKLDGRRIMLRLNIQSNGAVTYPTLDDVTLNGTELGSCLKSAARLMVFPKFKGDTMHVEVPLVLAGGR